MRVVFPEIFSRGFVVFRGSFGVNGKITRLCCWVISLLSCIFGVFFKDSEGVSFILLKETNALSHELIFGNKFHQIRIFVWSTKYFT